MNKNVAIQKTHLQEAADLLSMIETCDKRAHESAWWAHTKRQCIHEYSLLMTEIIVDHTEGDVKVPWYKKLF